MSAACAPACGAHARSGRTICWSKADGSRSRLGPARSSATRSSESGEGSGALSAGGVAACSSAGAAPAWARSSCTKTSRRIASARLSLRTSRATRSKCSGSSMHQRRCWTRTISLHSDGVSNRSLSGSASPRSRARSSASSSTSSSAARLSASAPMPLQVFPRSAAALVCVSPPLCARAPSTETSSRVSTSISPSSAPVLTACHTPSVASTRGVRFGSRTAPLRRYGSGRVSCEAWGRKKQSCRSSSSGVRSISSWWIGSGALASRV
mmetsp:Transcript_5561/g.12829  ORF Transcript_5561/g.12829 Transcript_5561/m.12829 type:complete len:267 (-) Transcript_5561:20-820(-)